MPKKVLIVEDDPKNLKLCRDLLQTSGYQTFEAPDGAQGVEMSRSIRPDLILMDIMMPRMDGLEATRLIKADEATRQTPVIALTAYAMKGDKERTLEAGCDGYVAKPVDILELLRLVRRFCPSDLPHSAPAPSASTALE
jgi:two-component system cell cycle response regulator DivK